MLRCPQKNLRMNGVGFLVFEPKLRSFWRFWAMRFRLNEKKCFVKCPKTGQKSQFEPSNNFERKRKPERAFNDSERSARRLHRLWQLLRTSPKCTRNHFLSLPRPEPSKPSRGGSTNFSSRSASTDATRLRGEVLAIAPNNLTHPFKVKTGHGAKRAPNNFIDLLTPKGEPSWYLGSPIHFGRFTLRQSGSNRQTRGV